MAQVRTTVKNLKLGDRISGGVVTYPPYTSIRIPKHKCMLDILYDGDEVSTTRTWGRSTTITVLNRV